MTPTTKLLTAPVSTALHGRLRNLAKTYKIPVRVLVAMLVEHGLDDIAAGRLSITRPEIKPAA